MMESFFIKKFTINEQVEESIHHKRIIGAIGRDN